MSVQNLIQAAKEALTEWHQGCSSAVNVTKLEAAITAAEKALDKHATALRLARKLADEVIREARADIYHPVAPCCKLAIELQKVLGG